MRGGINKLYNVDVLQYIPYIRDGWKEFSDSVIENFWKHTILLERSLNDALEKVEEDERDKLTTEINLGSKIWVIAWK